MKTETKKLPAVLEENVKASGLEISKAQAIAAPYAPLMEEASAEAEKLKGLKVDNPEDVATAKRIRLDLSKICSRLKTQKDDDKALIKIEDRYIMGLYNAVEGFARLTQKDAEHIEKHAERLEDERLEKVKTERLKQLEAFGVDGEMLNVEHMSEEVWTNYLNGVKLNFDQKKEAEAKAEAERIEAEKVAKVYNDRKNKLLPLSDFVNIEELTTETDEATFNIMLAGAERKKNEAAEAIKLHNDRTKELADVWAYLSPEDQAKNWGAVDVDTFEDVLRSATVEKQKATEAAEKKAKAEKEAREKAEKEAKEAKEKAEAAEAETKRLAKEKADRIAAEEKAKKAEETAKKKAEKAPDVDKLIKMVADADMPLPELATEEAKKAQTEILAKFMAFKVWAAEVAKNINK